MFSEVLLTVDFDRTLTAPDSSIPNRNIEAIRYFMENGGTFTVNTGRSVNTFRAHLNAVPTNAPLLLYNGSAAYENGVLSQLRLIDLPMWEVLDEMAELFPDMNLEVQGMDTHYLINSDTQMQSLYAGMGWDWKDATRETDMGPFIKFALFGQVRYPAVSDMFTGSPEELQRFADAQKIIEDRYGDKVVVFRAAPRILDIHCKGVSKLRAARDLQAKLGKKYLVCVGDAENDITMLEGADFAFCPSDGVVADRFPNVCPCGEGAVADVIYKKIPEILGLCP